MNDELQERDLLDVAISEIEMERERLAEDLINLREQVNQVVDQSLQVAVKIQQLRIIKRITKPEVCNGE